MIKKGYIVPTAERLKNKLEANMLCGSVNNPPYKRPDGPEPPDKRDNPWYPDDKDNPWGQHNDGRRGLDDRLDN